MNSNSPYPFFAKFILKPALQNAQVNGWPMERQSQVMFSEEPSETVEAQRRRRGSEGGPSGRADMPGRPSQSRRESGGTPPSGGGGTSGGAPGGLGRLPVGVVIILLILYFVFKMFTGSGDVSNDTNDQQTAPQDFSGQEVDTPEVSLPEIDTPEAITSIEDTPAVQPTRVPIKPLPTSVSKGSTQTWTVMLYQDADDQILEQDIYMDLNEAERVGSGKQVNIVAQMDRYLGAYRADGDWTSARRYYLTQDDDLFHLHSKMVADLGEVSMADPQTLVDFATWAIKTYPADKYVLILSDHGMGWPGGITDPKPSTLRSVDTPFAQAVNENMMFTNDIDDALGKIRQQTGIDGFELVGLDACLMSHLEVYSALAPHARYVVSSQETEPALGWAYSSFLQALKDNPAMDGAELSKHIVSSFIDKDERIINKEARLDFLRQGSPLAGLFGAPADVNPAQLTRQIGKSITLTAARMDALPALMDSVNQLVYVLQNEKSSLAARARTYTQTYTSIFGKDSPPSYIDLGNFAQLLQKESSSSAVQKAAKAVIEQVNQIVVAEKHGAEKPGSTGISVYFPNSKLYQNRMAGAQSYTIIADRFVRDSLWDDFLAYHYTGIPFEMETGNAAVPGANTRIAAPGEGKIEVSPLRLSANTTDYDQPVTLEADIKGLNIGYIYLFVGYYDNESDSILIADKDYLESPQTRQIGDLYYPNWTDDQSFKLKYTWTPSVFAIDDGSQTAVALLNPESYGATAEEAVYTTDGIYTDAETGESRYTRMYFVNGYLVRMVGYTSMEPTGAVREIIPHTDDQVTLIQTWLEKDGSGAYQQVTEPGETLTFGDQAFTWKEMYAGSGDYVIGFIVSDLEGNEQQVFEKINIK